MANNLELTGLVELYINPKDIPLVKHKFLMPPYCCGQTLESLFCAQVRIIAQSLYEADM